MNRIAAIALLFLAGLAQAATKNVVPRAANEGNLGTTAKPWQGVNSNNAAVVNQLTIGTVAGATVSTITADAATLAGSLTLVTPLGAASGGTGAATLTDGGLLLGSGTGAITALGVATNGQIPVGDGTTDPVLATLTGTSNEVTVTNGAGTITLNIPTSFTMPASSPTFAQTTITDPLGVPSGGSGAATFTDGGILLGSGAGAFTALGAAANGEIPIGDGTTDPVLATLTGTANEVTVTNGAGTITLDIPASFTMPASSPTFSRVTGALIGNADTATALAADPSDCTNQYATGIAANGNLTCSEVSAGHISAGAVDSDVFVSSVAVNAVYPAGVAAGTYSNITLPAANIAAGAMVESARFFAAADCDSRAATAAGSPCWDTSDYKLYVSTSATTGPDYVIVGQQ